MRSLVGLIAVLGVVVHASEPASVEGRWLLTAALPDGKIRLPVEITRVEKDRILATALGGGVKFSQAGLREKELVLQGTSTYGPLVIKAQIEGNRLEGNWRAGSNAGTLTGEHQAVDSSAASRLNTFDEVCQRISEEYFDPTFGGINWAAVQAKYRRQAEHLRTDGELFETVNALLRELQTSHLKFGLSEWEESVRSAEGASIAWRPLSPHTGYIRIASFEESGDFLRLIDRAFDELGRLPALVIDVRDNPGGTLGGAMRIGDHLLARPQLMGFFATRSGLERRKVRSMDELDAAGLPSYSSYGADGFFTMLRQTGALALVSGGQAQPVYRGKVIVLINRATASAAEAFAAVVQELGLAVLVGPRPTAGKMLSSKEVKLSAGWKLTLPEADFRTAHGQRVEGRGVSPDVSVPRASGGKDIPLIEAQKLAERR